mmetsp:Transcript_8844/g.32383  ORF Transcript_8844/g.32383 Transcript_8844/m.32383 type:complete len:235 (+) Transcript_8844:1254-1958(+)
MRGTLRRVGVDRREEVLDHRVRENASRVQRLSQRVEAVDRVPPRERPPHSHHLLEDLSLLFAIRRPRLPSEPLQALLVVRLASFEDGVGEFLPVRLEFLLLAHFELSSRHLGRSRPRLVLSLVVLQQAVRALEGFPAVPPRALDLRPVRPDRVLLPQELLLSLRVRLKRGGDLVARLLHGGGQVHDDADPAVQPGARVVFAVVAHRRHRRRASRAPPLLDRRGRGDALALDHLE